MLIPTPGHPALSSEDDPPRTNPPIPIYRPLAADFRPAYDRDAANGRVQTWPVYWSWVQTYYQGNVLSNGWIKETETSLAAVTDPAARAELLKVLNEAGRLTSREWGQGRHPPPDHHRRPDHLGQPVEGRPHRRKRRRGRPAPGRPPDPRGSQTQGIRPTRTQASDSPSRPQP